MKELNLEEILSFLAVQIMSHSDHKFDDEEWELLNIISDRNYIMEN